MRNLKNPVLGTIPFLFSIILFLTYCNDPDPVEVSCEDGKKNGTETGIDCGGPCAPCLIRYYDVVFPEYESMSTDIEDQLQTLTYAHKKFISGIEEDLTVEFFEPEGDTENERPLILMLGGTTLSIPPIDSQFYAIYDYASFFASRGFTLGFVSTRYWDMYEPRGEDAFVSQIPSIPFDNWMKARADLLSAIRFFKENAGTYQIDEDNIWLMGYSGGGSIALWTSYLNTDDLDEIPEEAVTALNNNGGIEGDDENKDIDASIKGIINLSGFNPTATIADPGEPPSLNIIGANDNCHPAVCETINTPWGSTFTACGAKAIASRSPDNEFYEITTDPADCMAPMDPLQCPECTDLILDFIFEHLGY